VNNLSYKFFTRSKKMIFICLQIAEWTISA